MARRIRNLGILLLILAVAIQFIRPARNQNTQVLHTDIVNTVPVPQNVLLVLKKACYDCHSNYTRYPWYTNIQPVGWMMDHHVKDGKRDLNFSEFGSYSVRKQKNKLSAISKQIQEGEMPISSYTAMHKAAQLSKDEKNMIISWADSLATKEE